MFLMTGASTTYAKGSDLVVYVMAVEIKWGVQWMNSSLPRLVVYVGRSPCQLTPCVLGCVAFLHVLEPARINFFLAWNSWGYFSWKGLFGRHRNSYIWKWPPFASRGQYGERERNNNAFNRTLSCGTFNVIELSILGVLLVCIGFFCFDKKNL